MFNTHALEVILEVFPLANNAGSVSLGFAFAVQNSKGSRFETPNTLVTTWRRIKLGAFSFSFD